MSARQRCITPFAFITTSSPTTIHHPWWAEPHFLSFWKHVLHFASRKVTHEEASTYKQTSWHTGNRLVACDGSFHECEHAEPATIPAVFDAHMTHSKPAALCSRTGVLLIPGTILKNHTDRRKPKTLKGTLQKEEGSPDTNLCLTIYCSSSSTTWACTVPLFVNHTSVTAMSTRRNNWMNKFVSQIWLARHQGNQFQQTECFAPEHNYSVIRCLVQCAKCNTCQGYDNFGFGLVSSAVSQSCLFGFFFLVVSTPFFIYIRLDATI